MYRLLLVDDEVEIVDWLYELFQEETDLELDVYKALSGLEALDILGRTKIDVVVSDIRMPGINGLQLMEKIRGRWPLCRIIFLTGYTDFDCVYAAIQAEGVSYLLKTEEDERIVDAVRRAIVELERTAQNRELLERVNQYLVQMLPHRQRDYVEKLLLEPQAGAGAAQGDLDELRMGMRRDRPLYLAAGRFDRPGAQRSPLSATKAAVGLRLRTEELFGVSFASMCLTPFGDVDLLWLLQPLAEADGEAAATQLGGLLEALQDYSRQGLGHAISLVYLSYATPWERIDRDFRRMSRLLNQSFGVGAELLLNEHGFNGPQDGHLCEAQGCVRRPDWRHMSAALDRGDSEAFLPMLGEAMGALRAIADRDDPLAMEIYYQSAVLLLGYGNRRGAQKPAAADLAQLLRADAHASWAQASDYLLGVAQALFRRQQGLQEKSIRESVERIQNYIREHLGEDLSLVRLSEVFYFNPSYLSRLFKQSTGQNLTDYISQLRVERAQALLMDRKRKIADVTTAVGFDSQHYFSRFFKKYTGMTPQEYRESALRGG